MKTVRILSFTALLAMLLPVAFARVEFGLFDFHVSEFRDAQEVLQNCGDAQPQSFWCAQQDETLTRIPTKGADFFFNDAGELLAVFSKQQKGQSLGSYNLDNGQNLIPPSSRIPGGALLLDGQYLVPDDAESNWRQVSDTEYEGRFTFRVDGLSVERVVRVSNIVHTVKIAVRAERTEAAGGDEPVPLQLAFAGIGRQEQPIIKIDGDELTANATSQLVDSPSYISLQTNPARGSAIVMRPAGSVDGSLLSLDEAVEPVTGTGPEELRAQSLPGGVIVMATPFPPAQGAQAELAVDVYTGPNELVRFSQEGYSDLPGLFDPNILGRMSLWIIFALRFIHEYVGSWGLSIIVLTLLFRALIWPLITTQTKSMFGMQALQPKIQALQKKYKDDREKLTQETMKLYREAGVNPAGGCLPILLQMPLFIILWRVFVNFEFNEGFAWIPDLGQPDPFYILPALYVGVMVAQSYFATRGNQQQFRQQLFINVVFVFIMVGFPAGVILYFVVSMLVQVIQYWLLSRNRPQPVAAKAGRG